MSELMVVIARGPECPSCHLDTFDDWWLDRTIKQGTYPVSIVGRLKCHGCGKFFSVTKYSDGEVHSCMGGRSDKRTEQCSTCHNTGEIVSTEFDHGTGDYRVVRCPDCGSVKREGNEHG